MSDDLFLLQLLTNPFLSDSPHNLKKLEEKSTPFQKEKLKHFQIYGKRFNFMSF